MRPLLTGFLLLALAACAPRGALTPRGLGPVATTAEALGEALTPRRLAVVVGVDAYDDPVFPDLRHAGDDARALGETLARPASGFEVTRLTGRSATGRDAILAALRELRRGLRREDTVVVYFSGHGTRVPDGDTSRRFLLPADADPGDLEASAIDLAAVQGWFSELPALRRALVLDACFSGDGKSVVRPGTPPAYDDGLATRGGLGPGEAHLYATTPGRPSLEDDGLEHGVYTYYLLEALSWSARAADVDHDGLVTAWEAHDHARSRTLTHTGGVQVPEAALRVVGEADVVLAGDPGRRREADRALIYLYGAPTTAYADAEVVVDGRPRGHLPGVVAVAPGPHHLLVRSTRDGEALVDGMVRLDKSRAYRADRLAMMAWGPRSVASLRLAAVGSPVLRATGTRAAAGVELALATRRIHSPGRGTYSELALGGGVGTGPSGNRFVAWASPSVGWQADVRFLRWRAGWGVTGALVARDRDLRGGLADGWWYLTTGPNLEIGVVAGTRHAVGLWLRPHLGLLRFDDEQRLRPRAWTAGGLGVSTSW